MLLSSYSTEELLRVFEPTTDLEMELMRRLVALDEERQGRIDYLEALCMHEGISTEEW